jgi:hypothetical protein
MDKMDKTRKTKTKHNLYYIIDWLVLQTFAKASFLFCALFTTHYTARDQPMEPVQHLLCHSTDL